MTVFPGRTTDDTGTNPLEGNRQSCRGSHRRRVRPDEVDQVEVVTGQGDDQRRPLLAYRKIISVEGLSVF